MKIIALLIAIMLSPQLYAGNKLLMVSEEFPPLEYYEDGKLTGLEVEIVREAAKRLDLELEIMLVPWSTAINMVKAGHADGMFAMHKNVDRSQYLYFVEEPISYEVATLITRKDSPLTAKTLEDIAGWKIGQIRGASYSPQYDSYDKVERFEVKGHQQLIELLSINNRIDAAAYNDFVFRYRKFMRGELDKFKRLDIVIASEPQHLVFSKAKGTSHEKLSRDFNKVLRQLRKEGFIETVTQKYTAPDTP